MNAKKIAIENAKKAGKSDRGMEKKVMGEGEKKAPVKSIKLKIKFQKEAKSKAIENKKKEK